MQWVLERWAYGSMSADEIDRANDCHHCRQQEQGQKGKNHPCCGTIGSAFPVRSRLTYLDVCLFYRWKAEIESKTTPGLLNVVIHHGPGKVKSAARLKQYDVVLTTYGTLTAEMGNDDKLDAAKKKRKKRRAAPGLEDFVEHDESSEDEGVRRKEKGAGMFVFLLMKRSPL